jgi:hypothetical protein
LSNILRSCLKIIFLNNDGYIEAVKCSNEDISMYKSVRENNPYIRIETADGTLNRDIDLVVPSEKLTESIVVKSPTFGGKKRRTKKAKKTKKTKKAKKARKTRRR